jgi:DNA modification methylase
VKDLELIQASALNLPLPDESVQCIVTSPPYLGLRKYSGEQESIWPAVAPKNGAKARKSAEARSQREGGWRGAFGLEPTIEMYVDHTVTILRELRRVLRPDGVLFWNIGDSYAAAKGFSGDIKPSDLQSSNRGSIRGPSTRPPNRNGQSGLKPKDLGLIPARVAIAAQADGWWVRSMIVWAKPNPMPESVTDRPTDAYEYIIMLTKRERYFWDADAVRETADPINERRDKLRGQKNEIAKENGQFSESSFSTGFTGTRNLRNVWNFATQPYSGAHFATFPEELPRRCILAATSARGACLQCGAPWERVVRASGGTIGESWLGDRNLEIGKRMNVDMNAATHDGTYRRDSIGWRPTCLCRGQRGKVGPCVVLDPFGGSGTTGRVALELRRRAILCDVAYGPEDEYRRLAEQRTRNVQVEFF